MSGPRIVRLDDLPLLVGQELGATPPFVIGQEQVDRFADLTDDHQWIHVDPIRAAESGGTIVHGFFLLSLIGGLWGRLMEVSDASQALNYGLDRVRFVSPVRTGSAVVMAGSVAEVVARPDGFRVSLSIAITAEGAARPAVVATSIVLFQR